MDGIFGDGVVVAKDNDAFVGVVADEVVGDRDVGSFCADARIAVAGDGVVSDCRFGDCGIEDDADVAVISDGVVGDGLSVGVEVVSVGECEAVGVVFDDVVGDGFGVVGDPDAGTGLEAAEMAGSLDGEAADGDVACVNCDDIFAKQAVDDGGVLVFSYEADGFGDGEMFGVVDGAGVDVDGVAVLCDIDGVLDGGVVAGSGSSHIYCNAACGCGGLVLGGGGCWDAGRH